MTKLTFNFLKWYSLVWLGLGAIVCFADGDIVTALIAVPTIWLIGALEITGEEKPKDIQVNVK